MKTSFSGFKIAFFSTIRFTHIQALQRTDTDTIPFRLKTCYATPARSLVSENPAYAFGLPPVR